MLKDITLGQYYPGDSPVHRLDPRSKIVLTFAYIAFVFLSAHFWGYAMLGAAVIAVIAMARLPFVSVLRTWRPLLWIFIMTFLLNVFFVPGETVLLELWGVKVYSESLLLATRLGLKLLLLVSGTSLMTLTTSPVSLTDGLERLFSPLKKIHFPAHEMAMMITIALRSIPTLMEETDKIRKAQMSRGADFETGPVWKRVRNLIPLLVPLFVSAFRRAEDLAMAMESRCYRGGEGRTRMKVLRFAAGDAVAAVCMAALGAAVLLWG